MHTGDAKAARMLAEVNLDLFPHDLTASIAGFTRWQNRERNGDETMPLGRYLTFTSCLLLALLFVTDWYFPKLVAADARAEVDRTIIRLRSLQRWPEAIAFDTSLPTIAPPIAMTAETPPPIPQARSPKQAFAMVTAEAPVARAEPPQVPRGKLQKRRSRAVPASAPRIASYATGFRNALPVDW